MAATSSGLDLEANKDLIQAMEAVVKPLQEKLVLLEKQNAELKAQNSDQTKLTNTLLKEVKEAKEKEEKRGLCLKNEINRRFNEALVKTNEEAKRSVAMFAGVNEKFADEERRSKELSGLVSGLEKKLEALAKTAATKAAEEEKRSKDLLAVINTRFAEIKTTAGAPVKPPGGFFGRNATPPPRPSPTAKTAVTATNNAAPSSTVNTPTVSSSGLTEERFDKFESTLDALGPRLVGLEEKVDSDAKTVREVAAGVKAIEAKANVALTKVGKLSDMTAALDNRLIDSLNKMARAKPGANNAPASGDSNNFEGLGDQVTKLQETMNSFMKAEEDAGTVMDKLLPAVTKIQKSVESQSEDIEKMRDELFPKCTTVIEDVYAKLGDTYDKVREIVLFKGAWNRLMESRLMPSISMERSSRPPEMCVID